MKTLNLDQPIFFERNRVYRVYLGGEPYPEFFGTDEEGDNNFPEEWVASTVKAINPVTFTDRDGVSKIRGTDLYFDDVLKENKEKLLGDKKFDILIKILDSAVRLPMQVHPTKELAMKYFNSPNGKTESWYILKTRPNAKMYFGFKEKCTYEMLRELDDKSEYDKHIWESVAMEIEPKEGDCFIINAGLIHAIGYGCMLIEVQEPTDFTIQPENWCGDQHLTDDVKYMGIDKDEVPHLFNLDLYGENVFKKVVVQPKVEKDENGYIIANERTLETNIDGVFVAGDVRVKDLRQIVTATADGAIASNQIFKYLAK